MISTPLAEGAESSVSDRRLPRARFVLFVVALMWPAQLLTASGVVGGMAQPAMAQAFQTTQIAWFALAYTLAATLFTPFVVKLGDVFGKKNVMVAIAAIGLIGDLIVVLSPNFELVLVGRVIAGAYGPIAALAFAAARDVFPPRQVGTASGVIGAGLGLVILFAPFLSGFLLDAYGYQGPLWFIVVGATIALLLLLTLPPMPRIGSSKSFDVVGGILLGVGIVALVFVVGQAQTWGLTSPLTLGVAGIGLVFLVAFVLWERKAADPIFEIKMLRRRNIGLVLISTSVISGAVFSGAVLPTFLALFPSIPGVSAGFGWSATQIAFVGVPSAVITFATGFLTGRMASRVDIRILWLAGGLFVVAGFLFLAFLHGDAVQLIVGSSVLGLGTGFVVGTVPLLILGSVSIEEQGMANGMSVLLNNLLTALVSQVMYTALATSGTVADGALFYSDASFRNAWITLAVITAVGVVVALGIPRLLRPNEVRSGVATESITLPH